MERLAAIVLAAGRSSRMGESKPLADVDGRPLLAWAVETFKECGVHEVIVVAGYRRDEVARVAEATGATVLTNPEYDAGMYSSLQVGVRGVSDLAGRFFVLPADVALVRPETAGRLIRQGRSARVPGAGEAMVTLPMLEGVPGHPPLLAAALRREILDAEPPDGLRGLLDRHARATAAVPVDDPGVLVDADTPADLARVRARAPHEHLPAEKRCLSLLAGNGVERTRIAHSLVVAAVATSVAAALNARGQHLVAPLVIAGALLHDIARDQPRHADAGADLLDGLGYPRVAAVVRPHARLGVRAADEPDEAQIVYLADKLVQGARVVGLDQRFAARLQRHAGDEDALAGVRERREEAQHVLRRVEQALGVPVGKVLPEGASAPRKGRWSLFRRG